MKIITNLDFTTIQQCPTRRHMKKVVANKII